jgi:hypothetical protein
VTSFFNVPPHLAEALKKQQEQAQAQAQAAAQKTPEQVEKEAEERLRAIPANMCVIDVEMKEVEDDPSLPLLMPTPPQDVRGGVVIKQVKKKEPKPEQEEKPDDGLHSEG